jgi:predicted CoA-binding protein
VAKYQDRETARRILRESKVIAVVGLSDKQHRASYGVASYLQRQGYRIIPVNPGISEVLGEKSYPDLKSIPIKVDAVDIFRNSESVPPIVRSAVAIGAKAVWLQEGIVSEEAAEIAEEAGLDFVMDLCMLRMHGELFSRKQWG